MNQNIIAIMANKIQDIYIDKFVNILADIIHRYLGKEKVVEI